VNPERYHLTLTSTGRPVVHGWWGSETVARTQFTTWVWIVGRAARRAGLPRRRGNGRDVDDLARRSVTVCHPDGMSLLHLPVVPVPPEVSQVEGCSCRGLDWHLQDCTIFSVPSEPAREAVAAAHQRLREHSDALTRQLRAELAALAQNRESE
jgi:hypothetical protein